MFSNEVFIPFSVFFDFRIFVWLFFSVSVSLVKYSFRFFNFILHLIKLAFWVFLYLFEFLHDSYFGFSNNSITRFYSILFYSIYLFLAMLSLPCGAQALCCGFWAFSSCSSQTLLLSWITGSTAEKLSSCGTWAQVLPDIWDPSSLLSPGVEPGTPELEVSFLPTGLPVILNLASRKLSFSFHGVMLL